MIPREEMMIRLCPVRTGEVWLHELKTDEVDEDGYGSYKFEELIKKLNVTETIPPPVTVILIILFTRNISKQY